MDVVEIKNGVSVLRSFIPVVSFDDFRKRIISSEIRVLNLFCVEENLKNKLYAVLADEVNKKLYATSTFVADNFPSMTVDNPCLHMFERIIYEDTGVIPVGHPFLKPVRKQEGYEFLSASDYQTHEVAVGPVHAGIIEPGHFRFICNGERVNHLEIQLGYQHRGVEALLKKNPSIQLAESICGDSTVAHSLAFAKTMEALSGIEVSRKEQLIRCIALEMERMAIHVGDIGAIAGDVGYYMAADILAVTRTLVINTMLELSGSRFGKGLMKLGGVNYDIDAEIKDKIQKMLTEVCDRTDKVVKAMFGHATVLSRLENTAIVGKKRAKEIGLVGLAGRASGLEVDMRVYDSLYSEFEHKIETLSTGDVYARAYLRYLEINSSAKLIGKMMMKLDGEISKQRYRLALAPNSFVTTIVEGWRGEVVHTVLTDSMSYIENYKIKDPSVNNWFGLALAVRNNQISDFPVCNKSFNLSYCGFDL